MDRIIIVKIYRIGSLMVKSILIKFTDLTYHRISGRLISWGSG